MAHVATAIDATLERIVACIRERTEPELILMFGSRANGGAREDSDCDILLVVRDEADVEATGTRRTMR